MFIWNLCENWYIALLHVKSELKKLDDLMIRLKDLKWKASIFSHVWGFLFFLKSSLFDVLEMIFKQKFKDKDWLK